MHSLLMGALTASALVYASTAPAECPTTEDIAVHVTCGDNVAIATCLDAVGEWTNRLEFVKDCLFIGGCSGAEPATTAEELTLICKSRKGDSLEELRKRQNNNKQSSAASSNIPAAATTAKNTPAGKTTAAPKNTAKPTPTEDPATTDTPSKTPESSTPESTTPPSTAASSTPATTPSSTPSTVLSTASTSMATTTDGAPLVCLTTSQLSTTWCVTSTAADGATASACIPTTTPVIECAPGLICQTQAAGDTTCMVRQDNLTTSGLVVTIIFATVLSAFIASCCWGLIKTRKQSRRAALAREAAMLGNVKSKNTRDIEASNTYSKGRDAAGSDAHLPLINSQSQPAGAFTANSNAGSRDVSTDYNSVRPAAHRVPSGGYTDNVQSARAPAGAPRLHPGLSEMGSEEGDMGYQRGRSQGRI